MTTLALNVKNFQLNLSARLAPLVERAELWLNKSHQRRMLAQLDEHLCNDLGLSREQIREESNKPFWR